MMKLRIHGIKDGKHDIRIVEDVKNIPYFAPEFFGEVVVEGVLNKSRNRFNFLGAAKCKSKLTCDISLEEFIKEISVEISINLIADTTLFYMQQNSFEDFDEIAIHEDDEYYDISTDVKDILAVSLPMKRIAPQYQGKTFEDLYPQNIVKSEGPEIVDERWAALKNIKFN